MSKNVNNDVSIQCCRCDWTAHVHPDQLSLDFLKGHLHFEMLEWRKKNPKATYVRNRSVPLNVQRKGKSKIRQ